MIGQGALPPRPCGLPALRAFAVEIVHWTISFQLLTLQDLFGQMKKRISNPGLM